MTHVIVKIVKASSNDIVNRLHTYRCMSVYDTCILHSFNKKNLIDRICIRYSLLKAMKTPFLKHNGC